LKKKAGVSLIQNHSRFNKTTNSYENNKRETEKKERERGNKRDRVQCNSFKLNYTIN
jgi:hypothetical protein